MPYGIIFMSEVLPSLIFTAGGVLALWIGANTWLRLRKSSGGTEYERIAESIELLHQSVEDLRDDLRGQLDEVRELSGRIDFAERLLTKAREDGHV
jgi:hypothetical protein